METWLNVLKKNDFIGVKKHIKDGGNISDELEGGESVLSASIRTGCDDDIVMLLIENGADIFDFDDEGVSVFDIAITYNKINLVKYIIEKGIDVNKTQRRSGFTPLMCACSYGREDIVKILLDNGAKKEMSDSKGFKASDFARKMNKKSILPLVE